jgi:Spy/CpxP family protein refolding chaperone
MKKHLAILSLVAGLCAAPFQLRAEDPVPPKPPGGDKAPPPSGEKSGPKPEGERRRPEGQGGRMDPAERMKMMKEKLSLTSEQEQKMKAIFEKNAPEFKELMSKGRENLTDADRQKMGELRKKQQEEIDGILTPEQKEKMKEMRAGGPGGDRKPGDRKPGDRKPGDRKPGDAK